MGKLYLTLSKATMNKRSIFKSILKISQVFYLLISVPLGTILGAYLVNALWLGVNTEHLHECHCFDEPSIGCYFSVAIGLALPIIVEKQAIRLGYPKLALCLQMIKTILISIPLILFITVKALPALVN